MAQARRPLAIALASLAAAWACASRPVAPGVAPADPESAVRSFMTAVQANDLTRMGQLWGTKDGPAAGDMDAVELQRRLTVMQRYLAHVAYEVLPPDPGTVFTAGEGERHYLVRLHRNNCRPLVPVVVVMSSAGWLVRSVDLTEAGNPARLCPRAGEPATGGGRSAGA